MSRLTHTVTTTQGEFSIDNYDLHETAAGDAQKRCGINIDVTYKSPTSLRSNKIGFVQVMKVTKNGTPYLFSNESPRATDASSGDAGWVVDRLQGKTQGYYGMNDDLNASGTNYRAGSRTDDTTATDAWMHDRVGLSRQPGMAIDCQAMTYAIDIEHGVYLGGFSWGWSIDAAGTLAAKPVAVATVGAVQRAAIQGWNTQAALTDVTQRNAPGQSTLPVPALTPPPVPSRGGRPALGPPPVPSRVGRPALTRTTRGRKPWSERILPWNW